MCEISASCMSVSCASNIANACIWTTLVLYSVHIPNAGCRSISVPQVACRCNRDIWLSCTCVVYTEQAWMHSVSFDIWYQRSRHVSVTQSTQKLTTVHSLHHHLFVVAREEPNRARGWSYPVCKVPWAGYICVSSCLSTVAAAVQLTPSGLPLKTSTGYTLRNGL